MRFKRMFQWVILTFITMLFVTGCGDLESEIQDTRTVILNMDYNQEYSSRSSSSVSVSDLIPYNTHLILALPSWESLSSNYKDFYYSFGQGLRNKADKKVSLEIPLDTQMKIFAFLFKDNYSISELFSAIREVGYYGESQTFSIDTQTNNVSLGITLIKVPGSATNDITAPTASVTATTITASGNAIVQSTEIGTAYLVKTTISVSHKITSITGIADSQWNSVHIGSANIDINLSATGLENGTYKVYAVDTSGNVSSASSNSVTIATTAPSSNDITAPTASVTPDNITYSGSAHVQSTETGIAYLLKNTVTVSNLSSITGAADSQWNSVAISLANTDTMLTATGLVTGTYKVYAVDASGNLSGASNNSLTITDPSLEAFYPFNGNANDESENSYHGQLGDNVNTSIFPTLTTDRYGNIGKAFYFDGNDYIALDKYVTVGSISAITVCAWVLSTDNTHNKFIISFDRSESYRLALNDDANAYVGWDTTDNTGNTNDLGSPNSYEDGSWHHICGSYNSSSTIDKTLYVDGEIVNSNSNTHSGKNLGTSLDRYGFIGWGSEASSFDGNVSVHQNHFMIGKIDDVRIYSRSLSPAQIRALYLSEQP